MTFKCVKIFIFFFIFLPSIVLADENISIGLGYPYLCAKYNFLEKYAAELKYATGEGINIIGLRGYWDFYSKDKLKGFAGLRLEL